MKYGFLIFQISIYLLSFQLAYSQESKPVQTIYFIGDTGLDTIPSLAVQLLAFECFDNQNSTTIFLGDNVYPSGLHLGNRTKALKSQRILLNQFDLFQNYMGRMFWLAGNHDWRNGKVSGRLAVLQQAEFCNNWFKEKSLVSNRNAFVFTPLGARIGPVTSKLSDNLLLVMFDSAWILHHDVFHRVTRENGLSTRATLEKFYSSLDSLLSEATKQGNQVVIAAHHPVFSNGVHSHRKEPLRILINYTPLQFFGLFGLNRLMNQDLFQPRYIRFRRHMTEILSKYPGAIYIAGHEHNLQYLEYNNVNYVVSGAGSKTSRLDRYRYPSKFMDDSQTGFFSLEVFPDGEIWLNAYGSKSRGKFWSRRIRNSHQNDIVLPKDSIIIE